MISLQRTGLALLGVTLLLIGLSTVLWMKSRSDWQQHLQNADRLGEALFYHLAYDADLPASLSEFPVSAANQVLANAGDFEQISDLPKPALVTNLTIRRNPGEIDGAATLSIAIVSPALRYPLSQLDLSAGNGAQFTMGALTKLLATYCSEAVILANYDENRWRKFTGETVWHCSAVPADLRLLAVVIAIGAIAMCFTALIGVAAQFKDFAEVLGKRERQARTKSLQPARLRELQGIVDAVNSYRDIERQHLSERAMILSGVSHDLGTPATRLRLRAALIEDEDLRQKLETDIDQMTGIIESVLTYTRAELSTEDTRKISLTSLIEAIVADYQDVGSPVSLEESDSVVVEGGQSIFMSRRSRTELSEEKRIIIQGRPLSLRRAISNLIDNALKYGRRARVSLATDVDSIHILVEDEGVGSNAPDLEHLTQPFQRGENSEHAAGFGMGLTIVSSIAVDHGGALTFKPGRVGTIACISLPRDP
ncbi:MAG: sensor histidine kinase [Rhodobacteraceae bacterium]|nr:sensor histidine kinase [Paracoccaceae bacterium]